MGGKGRVRIRSSTILLAALILLAGGTVVSMAIMGQNGTGGSGDQAQAEDLILVQSDLPMWTQVGGIEAGEGNSLYTRYNMTQAAGCQFGSCNVSGPNVTLMIELFQFQDPGNATDWLNNVHIPRLTAIMNESTDKRVPSAPQGNGTLINFVAYDGKNDGWELSFHQDVFVCRIMIICPTGTADMEDMINYIADAQNDKIVNSLS
jgi:hypothetical protein